MISTTRPADPALARASQIGMLVSAMFLAGSSVVAGKLLAHTTPVFVTTFGSLLVALITMLPFMKGRFHELRELTPTQLIYLFLQGLFGIVLFRTFILYGLQSTSAVQAGIITGTTPAVLALFSIVLLGERPDIKKLVTVLLAVSGCLLLNLTPVGQGDRESHIAGSLLVLAAVCSECLFTIFRKRISSAVSARTNTTVLIFFSLLLVTLPALLESRDMVMISYLDLCAIIYYGVFATVFAYLLWTAAVGEVDGVTAGICTAAMPTSSVLLAVVILREPMGVQHLLGCLLIIACILFSTLSSAR